MTQHLHNHTHGCKICKLKDERLATADKLIAIMTQRLNLQLNVSLANRERDSLTRDVTNLQNDEKKRRDLISVAGHEIKTPVTALKLSIQLCKRAIEKGLLTPEKLLRYFELTEHQLDKLQNLVDEMLEHHLDINLERIHLNRQYMNLTNFVGEIVERYPNSNLTFHAIGVLEGKWDKHRIDQIVSNLITNAIKYGNKKPIEIRLHQNGRVILEVQDHGEGISKENITKIFDQFKRVTANEKIEGKGLGLYIVKEIVEAKGGAISVVSSLGEGSTFTVTFPYWLAQFTLFGLIIYGYNDNMKNRPKGWENSIVFTKKQFEKSYGKCPEWLWKILVENYKRMKEAEQDKL